MSVVNSVVSKKNVGELEAGMVQLNISRVDGAKGKSDRCLVTAAITPAFLQQVALSEIGQAWLVGKVDELRGKLASAATGSQFGRTIDPTKVFSLEALLAAMSAATKSERMTKESVSEWFDSDLAMLVIVAVAEKLIERAGGSESAVPSMAKLEQIAENYKAGFVRLCEREPKFNAQELAQLNKAIELLDDDYDSVLGSKIADKLMATKPVQIEDAL